MRPFHVGTVPMNGPYSGGSAREGAFHAGTLKGRRQDGQGR